ncbi:cytochrome o ubiquinol oxidase subunit IV [Ralstonia syzygii subsp. celebesensis]|uniref:Cytochrome bo(3) ubiquinol oxidase subunit 4 n=5 Tax=Ralstonia solanacearum species complex TaxID=3116862 RepID=A0AAD0S4M4_RALSL|nr:MULTISPECIES: cytochrome o ubiquinol oxidase subunit IV [Ralstonia solanacearum species complex]CAH0445163.1 Cytochrome bo(3) ubiquinol oxidase subunit 4 [Ralstonia syzygii subsp. syzygii]CCA81400.1 cytochrome o ubiquinol oxidase, subunit IV [blood disease bacterium R229]BEU70907.1 cytochrome o ubiquinol oxidase subunit IV [Ralstonia pseudosolanacearum]AMP36486.1 cytochrome o ubiquinol oxidase subunit IV [Ralstonia solanacearum]AQW30765.1 cytochrome o ubiquinol oxidase subunit IV [blood dis
MEQTNVSSNVHADAHGHAAGGAGHATVKGYLIGFVLAVILTVIPFKMVMGGGFSHGTVLVTVMALAVVQIVVHLIYFLHLDGSSSQRWNVMAFLFTLLILAIVIVGSLWVMHNMNANMMMH